jgi:hypothetical protein
VRRILSEVLVAGGMREGGEGEREKVKNRTL